MIVKIMNIPQPWVLSIDRTEWRSGQIWLNILVLGLVHNGVALSKSRNMDVKLKVFFVTV
jgi:hypothetical protein